MFFGLIHTRYSSSPCVSVSVYYAINVQYSVEMTLTQWLCRSLQQVFIRIALHEKTTTTELKWNAKKRDLQRRIHECLCIYADVNLVWWFSQKQQNGFSMAGMWPTLHCAVVSVFFSVLLFPIGWDISSGWGDTYWSTYTSRFLLPFDLTSVPCLCARHSN